MNQSLERYIGLSVTEQLDKAGIKSWLKSVTDFAPGGIVTNVQMIDDDGKPHCIAVVKREAATRFLYLVPLTRDMSEGEIQKIVDGYSTEHPEEDFEISTSAVFMKPEDGKTISVAQAEHLSLCMALAKSKHEEWVKERTDAGWRFGTMFNAKEKTHPLIRPWDQLPERYRKPDIDWPQKLIGMLNSQGYMVIKSDELKNLMKMLRGIV